MVGVVCGLVELIATAGLATDAPDEGSGPARRGRARLQHMSGSRVQVARHPWDRGRRVVAALCGPGRGCRYQDGTSGGQGDQTAGRGGSGDRERAHGAGARRGRAGGVPAPVRADGARASAGSRRRRWPGPRRARVLEVVMEPTGPAWLPIAVFFTARGHLVFRVSSAKAADLRRFLSRHAKSNGIDADTLGPVAVGGPGRVAPVGAARRGGGRVGPAGPGHRPVDHAGRASTRCGSRT